MQIAIDADVGCAANSIRWRRFTHAEPVAERHGGDTDRLL